MIFREPGSSFEDNDSEQEEQKRMRRNWWMLCIAWMVISGILMQIAYLCLDAKNRSWLWGGFGANAVVAPDLLMKLHPDSETMPVLKRIIIVFCMTWAGAIVSALIFGVWYFASGYTL